MAPRPTELRQRTSTDLTDTAILGNHVEQNGEARKLVGIEGKWYDVTDFLPKHPGGPVLEQFVGQDASTVFKAYGHPDWVLKQRKPAGTYKQHVRHPADPEFDCLEQFCNAQGFFTTDYWFYAKKMLFVACLMTAVVILVTQFEQWYMHYLGAATLAFVWQQSGFIMHEFMHGQVVRSNKRDRLGGLFFGTVLFGMSAHWWQAEHIIHHAMTNTVDVAKRFADPQMWENVWAQNKTLFPLFKGRLQYYLIKIQHITFIPVVMFCGRAEIIIDSYRLERRWYEWIAIILHWSWMVPLLSALPTWREVLIFYFIAASVEGIFHFQLILSHYAKAFANVSDFHKMSWYEYQVLSNMNIECPWWQDWYYGGLNFHIEHHLFPRMARQYLRRVSPYVKEICKKHNIDYDMRSFTGCLTMTLQHLKETANHYKLDPR